MSSAIVNYWHEFLAWWRGTTIGSEIDAAAVAAKNELVSIGESQLSTIAEATATGILTGLPGGTASAIASGITAAEAAFKAASAQVSSATVATFTATLHQSIASQQAAGAVTPAAS